MADAFITNQCPTAAAYGNICWLFINMLRSAGWTVQASGDGLAAYNSAGNVFSNAGATGANGFGNAKAWVRLQDPGGVREIIFQSNNTNGVRIKYSPSAKFTGGAGSATVTPTATDEQYICGTTTDAAPTFNTAYFSGSAMKFQGGARGTSPYSFWWAGILQSSSALQMALMMDGVTGVTADNDRVVWYVSNSQVFLTAQINTNQPTLGATNSAFMCFWDAAKTAWFGVGAIVYANFAGNVPLSTGAGAGVNPFDGNVNALPVWYCNSSGATAPAARGSKGWSTSMRWTTVPQTTFIDTLNSKQWVCVGHVFLFWDGSTTPSSGG